MLKQIHTATHPARMERMPGQGDDRQEPPQVSQKP
jgi:hypothetical protein